MTNPASVLNELRVDSGAGYTQSDQSRFASLLPRPVPRSMCPLRKTRPISVEQNAFVGKKGTKKGRGDNTNKDNHGSRTGRVKLPQETGLQLLPNTCCAMVLQARLGTCPEKGRPVIFLHFLCNFLRPLLRHSQQKWKTSGVWV